MNASLRPARGTDGSTSPGPALAVTDLRKAFGGQVIDLPECGSGNVVALAAASPAQAPMPLDQLEARARALKATTGLDLLPTLRRLKKAGPTPDGALHL